MGVCPVPGAAVLCGQAMVLLRTLLTTVPTAAAVVSLNTTTSCAPASCGGLKITYPFWLAGKHPPECGYKAFQVTCDEGYASLKKTYWTYKILDISYENSSSRVTNIDMSDGTCDKELNVNTTSDLVPFQISLQNQELFFLYNCQQQARQLPPLWAPLSCDNNSANNSFAWFAEKYKPDDNLTPLPGNCTVSLMPVMGYEGATGADYHRLMEGGFLLDYTYTAEGCDACKETGGRCRINNTVDELECHCSDGVYPFSCDEVQSGKSSSHRMTVGIGEDEPSNCTKFYYTVSHLKSSCGPSYSAESL